MKRETDHEHAERLSEYLDGGLTEGERAALEAHVAGCGACRAELEGLRALVARARALREREPERDLWPGIAAAIRAPIRTVRDDARVIALPVPSRDGGAEPAAISARVSLTRFQLAAAAVVLMTISAGATWWAGPGVAVRGDAAAGPSTGPVLMTAQAPAPPAEIATEVAALEATLAQAGAALDPNTVRILERNLAVIERAIEDSRQALAVDPANPFLADHLDRAYRRKLTYLREAARIVDWAG